MIENPLAQKLRNHRLILASASPRRQMFLKELGLTFKIKLKEVEENYPTNLKGAEISAYLSKLKADAFIDELKPNDILLTADTVVWHNGTSLAKASSVEEAREMLGLLSKEWHEVITSITFSTTMGQKTFSEVTKVKFKELSKSEIDFYIETFRPFDKAGAYGIQEWIGLTAIETIQGSYTNVVGLPTHLVYKTLMDMVN
ncbi:MAG: septum formation protein Maf [Croceitalea sp.]|nr:septum formation protein Maf [Croceitalea sp.]MBT8237178.1 septum formation protein Maf [Croceitalea sp.]NNL08877.1 septum formation protein Maf [Croceitalea sp.]NNM19004.1 septum formation protein Maf [Croceitalea sp.]